MRRAQKRRSCSKIPLAWGGDERGLLRRVGAQSHTAWQHGATSRGSYRRSSVDVLGLCADSGPAARRLVHRSCPASAGAAPQPHARSAPPGRLDEVLLGLSQEWAVWSWAPDLERPAPALGSGTFPGPTRQQRPPHPTVHVRWPERAHIAPAWRGAWGHLWLHARSPLFPTAG